MDSSNAFRVLDCWKVLNKGFCSIDELSNRMLWTATSNRIQNYALIWTKGIRRWCDSQFSTPTAAIANGQRKTPITSSSVGLMVHEILKLFDVNVPRLTVNVGNRPEKATPVTS